MITEAKRQSEPHWRSVELRMHIPKGERHRFAALGLSGGGLPMITEPHWRSVGLRMHIPKGETVAFAALGLAELFDVETGEPWNAKWDAISVDFSPEGAVCVTLKIFPQKIEIKELA